MARKESIQESIQRRDYERLGAYHRSSLEHLFHPTRVRYDLALKLLPGDLKGVRCLDFGGGDAAMATLLADRGAKIVVADALKTPLEYAAVDARLDRAQAKTYMPLKSGSFEAVIMLDVLEHVCDQEEGAALEEALRLLVDRGLFVISAPSKRRVISPKHYRHYSLEELTDKLKRAGFIVEKAVPYKELMYGVAGKRLVSIPIGKIVRGVGYTADWITRSKRSWMGLVQCQAHKADNFIVLARKDKK